MHKNIAFLFVFISFLCGEVFAASPSMRIDLVSASTKAMLIPEKASENIIIENPKWIQSKSDRERSLWVVGPDVNDNEWHDFEFSFKSSSNTEVNLRLSWANPGTKNPVLWGAYCEIKSSGTYIKNSNFSKGLENWDGKPKQISKETPYYVTVSYKYSVSQKIYVKANQTITIKGKYRKIDIFDINNVKDFSENKNSK